MELHENEQASLILDKNGAREGHTYFEDGVRAVDFMLAFKTGHCEDKKRGREIFLADIVKEKLQLEYVVSFFFEEFWSCFLPSNKANIV